MAVKEDEEVVNFVLLEEAGPRDVLLFSCKTCPDSKLTSFQLESHMVLKHDANKLTVELPAKVRTRSRKPSMS